MEDFFLTSKMFKYFYFLIYFFLILKLFFVSVQAKYIRKCGYPAETHKIVTEDGYILRTHRIPHGKASNRTNENVVLVVHGLASSAEGFISLGPNDALAFLLADRGFDVWLFNARGTLHGRRHKTKSPNYLQGSGFWNFR